MKIVAKYLADAMAPPLTCLEQKKLCTEKGAKELPTREDEQRQDAGQREETEGEQEILYALAVAKADEVSLETLLVAIVTIKAKKLFRLKRSRRERGRDKMIYGYEPLE